MEKRGIQSIFDVIIIGGGHAGVEAAHAAASLGVKTALISLSRDRIGFMPCNPSIGGIGKGHIVFEIAALGGLMPRICTQSYLQAKMLNTSKGPAVQGLRLQIDKHCYQKKILEALDQKEHLTIIEDMVDEVLFDEVGRVRGVVTASGYCYTAPAVVLTGGTFLNGLVHVGQESHAAGRLGEAPVIKLAQFLRSLDIRVGRMKTGTPPRILRSSIDFSVMERDVVAPVDYLYELEPHAAVNKMDCFITHTNEYSHKIILDNAHLSPIFSKKITGTPTRYCPSIEDKIVRFSHKTSHHVFVEPESESSDEMYPNGISNSLPREVQEQFVRTIAGFEHAIFTGYAYGIEYDFVSPHQLHHSLELKKIPGLFLAGQINGTTGYEEAAGQGIIAGINAARKVRGLSPYIMSRNEGYIGIMIDDLVTLGVDEPYRMFTSRAERRLILRQDNTFARLTPVAYELGLISVDLKKTVDAENEKIEQLLQGFGKSGKLRQFAQLISNNKPEFVKQEIRHLAGDGLHPRAVETVYAEILYGPYKQREIREVEKNETYRTLAIPETLTYTGMPGLPRELQEKLNRLRPATIAQASLIPGITPATLSLLIFRVREQQKAVK
ncbi:MAG: tRNA uridine-5-carboxymethylaminomethyl(34) synthesis enzyme MnmG [Candidatus Babeliaceae bacterium]|nr:tRNA uridine-5-carboxymethylaminomethyl(34) synthesis enzyme MnmG [Candidatus Babeliaceae bacterium]